MGVRERARLSAEVALDDILRGRVASAASAVAALPPAWSIALSAAWWHAEPERGALPSIEAVHAAARSGGRDAWLGGVAACVQVERACLVALDAGALERWLELHRAFAEGAKEQEAWVSLEVAGEWLAIRRGTPHEDARELEERARALARQDARPRTSALLVEVATVRAMASLARDDLEGALRESRRASRMARTEALPQSEYLANVVLARARRLSGRPHLATRILRGLAEVAPRPWWGWLGWELALAGAADVLDTRGEGSSRRAPSERDASGRIDWADRGARAVRDLLDAARAGARKPFEGAVRASDAALRDDAPRKRDLVALVAALDPDRDPETGGPEVASWCSGEEAVAPPVIAGACSVDAVHMTSGYVAAWPGDARRARRVAAAGTALVASHALVTTGAGPPGRVEATVATLALAREPWVDVPSLFRKVYGFAFDVALHRGVLDVLLHRVRARLGDLARLEREHDALRLVVLAPLYVPDPRCVQSLEELVVRLIAREGASSARDAARALEVPLRTVHRALQQLVAEGACELRKEGRHVEYVVEDTTFSEPTKH